MAGDMNAPGPRKRKAPRIGFVTEAMADRSLLDVMDWVVREAPAVTDLEVVTGGYAPPAHCDMPTLLHDAGARRAWQREVEARGLRVAALNTSGNPLHPDPDVAAKHDSDLRDTIRLAAALGVNRVVAMAGCPAAAQGDRTPHFAAGGWIPNLEGVHETQWAEHVIPYWGALAEFARREQRDLRLCIELHPGMVAFNVETFERLAALGPSIAANIDPSHFFWMAMDPIAVVEHLGERSAHSHGKDVVFIAKNLALNGLLDHLWTQPPDAMPWNFAVVGRGRDQDWWNRFVSELCAKSSVQTIAIEHEDPFVPADIGVKEAAAMLSRALAATAEPALNL
jgi:sugar phosphate isomerase/epimerase